MLGSLGIFTVIFSLLIPVAALIFVAVIIWLVVRAATRQRDVLSKERLTALEHGIPLPPAAFVEGAHQRPHNSLRAGIVELGLGAGLVVALLICCPASRLWGWGVGVMVLGLAHLAYWGIHGRREWEEAQARQAEIAGVLAAWPSGTSGREDGEQR